MLAGPGIARGVAVVEIGIAGEWMVHFHHHHLFVCVIAGGIVVNGDGEGKIDFEANAAMFIKNIYRYS